MTGSSVLSCLSGEFRDSFLPEVSREPLDLSESPTKIQIRDYIKENYLEEREMDLDFLDRLDNFETLYE